MFSRLLKKRLGVLNAFSTEDISTYDGFVKIKTHCQSRQVCTDKIENGCRVFGFCQVEEKGRVSMCWFRGSDCSV